MGLFDFFNNDASGRDEVYNMDPNASEHHKAKLSHELIGGAAGFEAMKLYEDHCRQNGQPANHAMAKELLAGFAAAEVDRLIETKGLDSIDREKAKRHAQHQVDQALQQSGQFQGGGDRGFEGQQGYGGPQGGYGGPQGGYGGPQGGYGGQQGGYGGQQGEFQGQGGYGGPPQGGYGGQQGYGGPQGGYRQQGY